jgi:hypothetical protein
MEEPDIARAATEMIRLHGQAAEMMAAEALDKALELGDTNGFSEWTRIAVLIAIQLRQAAPKEVPIEIAMPGTEKRVA